MEVSVEKATGNASQLAEARAVLATSGKSSRQLGNESRMKVVDWIYAWGYTSSSIIQEWLGKTSGGYAQKLVKQGWLTATKTESGIPATFYTLTELGLQEAERHAPELYRYPESDPYKVNQQLIRHNLLAQQITVNGLKSGAITSFQSERMFAGDGDKSGIKHPDVVWVATCIQRIGVEVELSAKWARDLDEFALMIIKALQTSNGKPAQYSRFLIVSDSPAIIERYRKAIVPEATLNIWKKNKRNHWVIDKTTNVPAWLSEKVDFQLIER